MNMKKIGEDRCGNDIWEYQGYQVRKEANGLPYGFEVYLGDGDEVVFCDDSKTVCKQFINDETKATLERR